LNKNIIENVKKISDFIKSKPWMDFELIDYSKGSYRQLSIGGAIDTSIVGLNGIEYDIEIYFKNVFYMSVFSSWSSDTSIVCFDLINSAEEKKINIENKIEEGNYIFYFQPEDYSSEKKIIIASECIDFKLSSTLGNSQ